MAKESKIEPSRAHRLTYEQGRIIIATAFIALLALLIESRLLIEIEEEIGRLVGNSELAGVLAKVLLFSILLFAVYLGFASFLYAIREQRVGEVAETFEVLELFAFRGGFLFISYSLVLFAIYSLIESLPPSISYPIYFGAWFVFLLLYGLAGVGVKGFILKRHRYPIIVGAVFGYELISSHGAPIVEGIENLLAADPFSRTLLILVSSGLLFFFSSTTLLMSVVGSVEGRWSGIMLCSRWKRKKVFIALFFIFAIALVLSGVAHTWMEIGAFVLGEAGMDETAIFLFAAGFFLLAVPFLPVANHKEVVQRWFSFFVFNLIAAAIIVGVIFEMQYLAGFAVLFFALSGLAVFSVAVVEEVLKRWSQDIKEIGRRFLRGVLPEFE